MQVVLLVLYVPSNWTYYKKYFGDKMRSQNSCKTIDKVKLFKLIANSKRFNFKSYLYKRC